MSADAAAVLPTSIAGSGLQNKLVCPTATVMPGLLAAAIGIAVAAAVNFAAQEPRLREGLEGSHIRQSNQSYLTFDEWYFS